MTTSSERYQLLLVGKQAMYRHDRYASLLIVTLQIHRVHYG